MGLDPCEVAARQKRAAAELGLPLGERTKTYNSRLAAELGRWAESQGKGDAFHAAVFRAYYGEGVNIAKRDVLLRLAGSAGLPEEGAAEVLRTRAFREAVDADWALAGRLGISAVPTFFLDSRTVVGAQPYEVLARFLTDHGVRPR